MSVVLVPIDKIKCDPKERQRKELNGIEELAQSIKTLAEKTGGSGLLHPIIIGDDFNLIAGGRRLEAHKFLQRTEIEARFFSQLNATDRKLVELDENLRRVDITWQERCLAVASLHDALRSESPQATADYIGLSVNTVRPYLEVAQAITKGDSKVLSCNTAAQAIALIDRRRQIAIDTEMSKISVSIVSQPPSESEPSTLNEPQKFSEPSHTSPKHEIIHGNFLEWAPTYTGSKFNFIHCDFPYGIGLDSSKSASAAASDTQYADSPDTFWALVDCLFDNLERIAYDSAHIMFWFSMKYYVPLTIRFRKEGLFVVEHPIIWHKSCGSGIASDYRRRPKHVYETALWCSLGDRYIGQLKNDVYSCPIAKESEQHMSAKPIAMLEHFLSMGVSELTDFLDPTCGSGTALRAAKKLGAARTLGLELNEDTAANARSKL